MTLLVPSRLRPEKVFPFVVLLPLLALIPAFIARQKNQDFWTFYVFGLLLWIVAVPVALCVKDNRRHCPYCIEPIDDSASVCPHCRRGLLVVAEEPKSDTGYRFVLRDQRSLVRLLRDREKRRTDDR